MTLCVRALGIPLWVYLLEQELGQIDPEVSVNLSHSVILKLLVVFFLCVPLKLLTEATRWEKHLHIWLEKGKVRSLRYQLSHNSPESS